MSDRRKMEITWETTPAELRVIADHLEKPNCRQVRVNWYHTRLIFLYPDKEPDDPCVDIEGGPDGEITGSPEFLIDDGPPGIEFFDAATQREMKLVADGPYKDWIVRKHPDGQWVTVRRATEDDLHRLSSLQSPPKE